MDRTKTGGWRRLGMLYSLDNGRLMGDPFSFDTGSERIHGAAGKTHKESSWLSIKFTYHTHLHFCAYPLNIYNHILNNDLHVALLFMVRELLSYLLYLIY